MPRDPKDKSRPAQRPNANPPPEHASSETPLPNAPLPATIGQDAGSRLPGLVQMHLLAAIQGMQSIAAEQTDKEQEHWLKHLQAIQAALRFVAKRHPVDDSPETLIPGEGAIAPDQATRFGAHVAQLRKVVDMSREKLAKRAGLSPQTVYNIETGKVVPTHETIVRLLAVKELGLHGDQIPWQEAPNAERAAGPNCWLAPGYDPLKMFMELFEVVNGHGGALEQTYAYLDHKSAMNWYALSNQGPFAAAFRANMPLEKAAHEIRDSVGRAGLDIVALGAGDGKQEVRLVQHLLALRERSPRGAMPDLRLYLLDVSQPLLSAAYQYADEHVGRQGVYVCAVQGNFHHWPQYTQLHHSPERAHRRRVIVMLGNTVGNLDNEARFFQYTLTGLTPGDLLLMDVGLAFGSPEDPDDIKKSDRLLQDGFQPAHRDWILGPLARYCEGAVEVSVKPSLDPHSPIPGSYSVDALATVKLKSGQEKRFSAFRFKRYDPARLGEVLRHLGWEMLLSMPFGAEATRPVAALMLFRKLPSLSRPF